MLSAPGSQRTPPFPPPKGRSTTAHFQVMAMASAATSSWVRAGWKRRPPLAGPRAVSWWIRQPTKTSTRPSSRRIGTDTSRTRFGRDRTARTLSSRPTSSAASLRRSTSASQGSNRAGGGAGVVDSPAGSPFPSAAGGSPIGAGGSSAVVICSDDTVARLPVRGSHAGPAQELGQPGDQWVRFEVLCPDPGHVVGIVPRPGGGGGVDRFGGEVEDHVVVRGGVVTHPLGPAEEAAHPHLEAGLLPHLPRHGGLQPLPELD